MDTEKRKSIVMGVFKDRTVQVRLINLYSRWLDEREYEDIREYGDNIKPLIERENVRFVKMVKRPFGPVFTVDNCNYHISITTKKIQVKQVK